MVFGILLMMVNNVISTNLKADLDNFLKQRLDPINKKMVEQEKARHKQFLERHFEKYDLLAERHDAYTSQLITLEGVIFGAVIIFTNSQQVTVWLVLAVCLILVSLIFGVWRQNISNQANYQSHEWNYYQELKNHWWIRELWKDEAVKIEKEVIEPNIKDRETAYEKKFSYKLLKFLRLDADRIENIFVISFILALFLLILHLLSKAPVLLNPPVSS
jgi:uncharacterized membrane protein